MTLMVPNIPRLVMAGLVPAIPLRVAMPCIPKRDHTEVGLPDSARLRRKSGKPDLR